LDINVDWNAIRHRCRVLRVHYRSPIMCVRLGLRGWCQCRWPCANDASLWDMMVLGVTRARVLVKYYGEINKGMKRIRCSRGCTWCHCLPEEVGVWELGAECARSYMGLVWLVILPCLSNRFARGGRWWRNR
jgi:hypothetical protein